MNIAYFGSPPISALLLEKLLSIQNNSFNISLVLTQKDKPVGKRLELTATPVKKIALKHNIEIFDEDLQLKQDRLVSLFNLHNIDLCIVYAYGNYIQKELLLKPKLGFWNIHPSLLPLYRGPSPIAFPIMLGDSISGTSLIQLTNILDGGPVILQKDCPIEINEMRTDLELKLTLLSVELIKEAIHTFGNSKVKVVKQDEENATLTKLLSKQDGFIEKNILTKALQNTPSHFEDLPSIQKEYLTKYKMQNLGLHKNLGKTIYDLYRALTPWPGLWTKVVINNTEKRLKIIKMSYSNNQLSIDTVQLEGKTSVKFSQFNSAYNIFNI